MFLFDLEKAFDRVWHEAFVVILYRAKLPQYMVKLLNSYITNRKFYIGGNKPKSELHNVSSVVPQ